MKFDNDTPWMLLAMALVVVIVTVAGGIVTLTDQATLSVQEYFDQLRTLAFAVAGLGAARAVRKGLAARNPDAPPPRSRLTEFPWMTLSLGFLVVFVSIVGAIVTIASPEELTFSAYVEYLGQLALAVAGLGAGRAARKGLAPPVPAVDLAKHPDHPGNALDAGVADLGGAEPVWADDLLDLEAIAGEQEDLEPLDDEDVDLVQPNGHGPAEPEELLDGAGDLDAEPDDELSEYEEPMIDDEDLGAEDEPLTDPAVVDPSASKPVDFR